ncbi:IS3 family transposase [Lactiplantibacillus plantarum]|uniref:IS3 family transposase n=1 Tax=Lactiplantibacillus plantarum TaxID=1590 RepID=UPI003521BBEA
MKAGIVHNCQYKNYKELEFTITSYVDYYTHCHIKTKSASISPVKHRKHTSQLTT